MQRMTPIRLMLFTALAAIFSLLLPSAANAIPAFARQTEQPCAACHVGAFGPQLTDFGRDFKINGYVWGKDTTNPLEHLSAMAFGGFESLNKADPGRGPKSGAANPGGPLTSWKANDNWSIDQTSLFYGGRIYGNLGMFAQATYADGGRSLAWDNTDIRYADSVDVGNHILRYGVTVNNNPTVQDVFQTAPSWLFPYVQSKLAPAPATQPFIIGALAQRVVGAGLYGELDDAIYAEFSGYTGLTRDPLRAMGMSSIKGTDDRVHGFNPYWRLAYDHHDGTQTLEIGTYGMAAQIRPGGFTGFGSDSRTDVAIDASFQRFMDDGKHIVSLYATAIHEDADLKSSFAQGLSANPHSTLNSVRGNASYYYDNTYGVTVGRFVTTGKNDPGLYPETGKPDNSGWVFQADVTPFGSEAAYGAPYLNLRFFIQYTMYDKFDGSANNIDGNGRSASNNNTLFVGLWTAF